MKTHNLISNTPEWLAYRKTMKNASDAPAMMGCSAYKTRSQLLHEKHTGMAPEVDPATQRRFDDGHRFEALARPLAEDIIGEELYPVTGSKGKYSASFDGLNMMESVAFEHKTLNDDLRAALKTDDNANLLPLQYRVQMEQQLMVSGAEKCLFMATKWNGDTLVEEHHCWYTPDLELRAQIIAGWAQFEIDLAAYTPTEAVQAAVAAPVMALPAVSVQVNGQLAVISNLDVFEVAVRAYITNLPTKPATDQEFADADAGCKAMSRAEDALSQVKAQTLGQVASVDYVVRTADMLADLCRTTRLALEKLVKARKEAIRTEITQAAASTFAAHIIALNNRLGRPYMPTVQTNFTEVIKGKKTVESLQNAVDTEMARAKVEANAVADKIQANMTTLVEQASDYKHLFADTAQIVLKAPDDLTALVKSRISDFKASEEKRLEAEREKIHAEVVAKLERAAADAAKIEAERVAKEAEQAKAARVEVEKVAQAICDALPVVEVKHEPVAQKTPLTVVAKSEPVYTPPTTRDSLNMLLGQMSEADLVRTLHFVQQRFFSEVAA